MHRYLLNNGSEMNELLSIRLLRPIYRFFNGDLAESEIAAIDTLDSICGVFKGRNFQMVITEHSDNID